MAIDVIAAPFDPWATLAAHQTARGRAGGDGACAVFVGTLRDFNEGDTVSAMTLEHYPGMTERALQGIAAQAQARWPLNDLLIVHRVGPIELGEAIVLTAAWSAHRQAAFAACRYLIEELKHRAPFWKKETLATGDSRWVERNTPAGDESDKKRPA